LSGWSSVPCCVALALPVFVGAILGAVRVVVLGGTRFIGPQVVRLLVEHGHEVTIVHRGQTEVALPQAVRHVHVPFAELPAELERGRLGAVDLVVDMVPYLDKGGHGVLRFGAVADRAVVITSCDVYRAFGRLWRSEPGPADPLPLTEDSPLRSRPAADRGSEEVAYDNVEVEKAVGGGALPVTILRLPATHGPGDRHHRLFGYLQRMDDRRPVIVLEERHAIALAVEDHRAAGRVYNVGEQRVYAEADWVRRIGEVVGWRGEVVAIAETDLPERLRQPFDFEQHYVVDSTRIRDELGYQEEIDEATALERTVAWERLNPPAAALAPDYAAEDEALASSHGRRSHR
jgi:nucleoside-diphosphate-sugar epimerase